MATHIKEKQPRKETLDSRLLEITPPLNPKPSLPPLDDSPKD